ncbi:MAG: hypothetical protein HY228_01040 [Candidatus Yonathbacteria bacterium]|nr:hypothetical protein [Candidatus Yonathbacteria bacterium]
MLKVMLGIIFGVATLISTGVSSLWNIQNMFSLRVNTSPVSEHIVPVMSQDIPKEMSLSVKKQEIIKNVVSKEKPRNTKTNSSPVITNGSLVPKETIPQRTAITPGPLIAPLPATPPPPSWILTTKGVIEYTNGARSINGGLPALIENNILDRDAEMKLSDMFAKQYFEHISPTGVGPVDLATTVGYAFVIVGENLALGDFGGDEKLVTAWMNSPGHRANILNSHYQEIGVAVGKGMYEGRETWLAVQSFGMPLSACPVIDAETKMQIDNNNTQISVERAQIDTKKTQIDSASTSDQNYNIYIGEYNNLLPPYNALIEATRALIAKYNEGVQAYNSCVTSASMH